MGGRAGRGLSHTRRMARLGNRDVLALELPDWRKLAQALHTRFLVPDLAGAAEFANSVAALPALQPPELRLRDRFVEVVVATRTGGIWVTEQDVELARAISALADAAGLESAPEQVAQLEWGLDTADDARIAPFWSALLTGAPGHITDNSVIDPDGRVPNLWFQGTPPHAPPRQRWHGDLWLPPEVAPDRIVAAVAAGGVVVDDQEAPAFVVLADPDGNRVCVCTSAGRD